MIRVPDGKLRIWLIYGLLVTFMTFKLKSMAFPIKLTPYDPNQGKKNKKNQFFHCGLGLGLQKIFSAFFDFFEIIDA